MNVCSARVNCAHVQCQSVQYSAHVYFLVLGAFVCFNFYPWGFSLSHHVIIWTELGLCSSVSRDHMNRNGIVHLDCWNIKILFCFLGLLSALIFILGAFVLWCFCPLGFSQSHHMIILTEWGMCTPVSRDHVNRNGIVHLDCWEYQNIFWVCWAFVRFDFYPWGFCLIVFLSIGLFPVPPLDHMNRIWIVHTCTTWSHEQKWDCTV